MVKKIFGGLFLAGALFMLIMALLSGVLFKDLGSVGATYGAFLGALTPIVLNIFSGVFLITFDNATKVNYIAGFKKRSKQTTGIIMFLSLYGILFVLVAFGISLFEDWSIIKYMLSLAPLGIPFILFFTMMPIYVFPHKTSKKFFVNSDSKLDEYLSYNETYYSYSNDNFVLASNKTLFFPKLLCVIPFDQISSVSLTKELWEQNVDFHLSNGKKICVVTNHYDRIVEAINANR